MRRLKHPNVLQLPQKQTLSDQAFTVMGTFLLAIKKKM
jgi:hypothetical protein